MDNETRDGLWARVPFLSKPAVALDEVVGAEAGAPADVGAGGAVGAEFAEDGDLAVAQEGVPVREKAAGSLRVGVDGIGRVGEMFEDFGRG